MVDKVRPVHGKGDQRTRTYKVKADRVYQGVAGHRRGRGDRRGRQRRARRPTLAQGKRYIFFVTEAASRLMATTATAQATTEAHRARSSQRLGSGAQPEPDPPATAEFTKVADAAPAARSRGCWRPGRRC